MVKNSIDINRLYWIDAVRSFACLCVIATHAIPLGNNETERMICSALLYLSKSGSSILFFMISGALVLYKPKPTFQFLRTRIMRIVLPMVIWSIIQLFIYAIDDTITWSQFFYKVILIPTGPQMRIYWFIYVIFGIYLLTPILSVWLEKCKKCELEMYMIIWLLAMTIPYFTMFDEDINAIFQLNTGYLYYFSGYLWFAVAGYYLRKYVNLSRFKISHYALYGSLVALPGILFMTPLPHGLIQNNLSLGMALLCMCHFVALKHIKYPNQVKLIAYDFAQHSFGIYLVHIFVRNYFVDPFVNLLHLNSITQIPLTLILVVILSYILVHLISKLPHSKYVVGI